MESVTVQRLRYYNKMSSMGFSYCCVTNEQYERMVGTPVFR